MWKVAIPLFFCMMAPLHVGIVIQLGDNPQPGEENVLLNTGTVGTTVIGLTNQSSQAVAFTSTASLMEPSNGQARVEAQTGLLSNITVSAPSGSFQDFVGNAFNGSGTAKITVIANEPGGGTTTTSSTISLGNGQNFFTVVASGGESIASINISASDGFADLQQARIAGITEAPEPGGLTVFLGLAAAFVGCQSRRLRALLRRPE